MSTNGWWVKIADFDISKRIENELGMSTTLKGTLGYIAPELHGFTEKGSPYAVDIWAVGEIAFQSNRLSRMLDCFLPMRISSKYFL